MFVSIYPYSLNKRALSHFSLVHYDIWSPSCIKTPFYFLDILLPLLMIIQNIFRFG